MILHHIRNATFIIESGDRYILIDPMLGEKGSGSPLTLFRFKPLKNPLVNLPKDVHQLLEKVTHCLVTHLHPDHLDKAGVAFLRERKIPVVCSKLDAKTLEKQGLTIEKSLKYQTPEKYLGGTITGIEATHGYGFVKKIAGNVMGFHLELPKAPSVYISSDTVYIEAVARTLQERKPDIAVLAAGKAQLDIGDLLLMNDQDLIEFVRDAPGKVLANHLEALNHCPRSRDDLRNLLSAHGLLDKVDIPEDGESVQY